MYIGMVGAFGMFIVANFQETAVVRIHIFAAILCFGSGCAYMLLQSWSNKLWHKMILQKVRKVILGFPTERVQLILPSRLLIRD